VHPTLSSADVRWSGFVLEYYSVPACVIPQHERVEHLVHVVSRGSVKYEVRTRGKTLQSGAKPGTTLTQSNAPVCSCFLPGAAGVPCEKRRLASSRFSRVRRRMGPPRRSLEKPKCRDQGQFSCYHHCTGQVSALLAPRAIRLCQQKANSASAPTPTGANRKLHDRSLTTTTSGSIPAGG